MNPLAAMAKELAKRGREGQLQACLSLPFARRKEDKKASSRLSLLQPEHLSHSPSNKHTRSRHDHESNRDDPELYKMEKRCELERLGRDRGEELKPSREGEKERKNGPLSFAGVKVKATLEKSRHGVKSEMLSRLIFCEKMKRRSDSMSTVKKK